MYKDAIIPINEIRFYRQLNNDNYLKKIMARDPIEEKVISVYKTRNAPGFTLLTRLIYLQVQILLGKTEVKADIYTCEDIKYVLLNKIKLVKDKKINYDQYNFIHRLLNRGTLIRPVLLNKDLELIDGYCRYNVFKDNGIETIPSFILEDNH